MKYPNGKFNKKPCRNCGELFQPYSPCHMYCSDPCKMKGYDAAYYRRTYGKYSVAVISRLRTEQQEKCYLCGTEGFLLREHHRQRLVVDHDHATGMIRKLLCHNCNRGLGLFQDNPELLKAAAEYVKFHKQGATTIPNGSTAKLLEAHSPLV
ncbi:MAG: hypothetical protein KGI54_08405 [Pseudomonadota bacterium]|nr:hypothetical protein [Pseudomonadota bacterium]